MEIVTAFSLGQFVYVEIDGNKFKAVVKSIELRKTGTFYRVELFGFDMVVSEVSLLRVGVEIDKVQYREETK